MHIIKYLLIISGSVYLLLFIFQRNLLYFPSPKQNHPYESQLYSNEGESVNVIILNEGQEKCIIFFGGNGEAVINNATNYLQNFPDYTVYLVNYRGYGESTGFPSEKAFYSDALHIYDSVKNSHSSISVIGCSLGTGVASYLASKRKIEKLVLNYAI